ncbi:MAG: flagellar hook-length control protein FliK [Candidatus Altiarchaeota archaeon]
MTRVEDKKDNAAVQDSKRISQSRNTESSNNRSNILTPTKIPFNSVLDQTKSRSSDSNFKESLNKPSESNTRTATEHAVRETRYERDGKESRKDTKHKEKDKGVEENKEERGASKALRAKTAEKKVVARSATGQRGKQSDTSGGGRETMTQGKGEKGKTYGEILDKSLTKKGSAKPGDVATAQGSFTSKMSAAKAAEASAAAQVFPKQVLDQIVQYIRVMTTREGKKEMEIHLHEKIFRGLRIKVSSADGKIHTTLMAQSSEALELLKANRGLLAKHLEEKGIDIEGIDVILLGDS